MYTDRKRGDVYVSMAKLSRTKSGLINAYMYIHELYVIQCHCVCMLESISAQTPGALYVQVYADPHGYAYVCVHCLYACTCLYTCVYTRMYMYICIRMKVYMLMYMHIYVYMCICICICNVHVYVYVYVYARLYV